MIKKLLMLGLVAASFQVQAKPIDDVNAAWDRKDYAAVQSIALPYASKGEVWAQYELGLVYSAQEDYVNALKWYRQAAAQGHATALNNVGFFYEVGRTVPKSEEEAVKWYRQSADKGDANGQASLAAKYYYGLGGLKKDLPTAIKLYNLSAEQDLAQAQQVLGILYYNGEGVKEDLPHAYMWWMLASENGDSASKDNLEDLVAEMSKKQLEAGKKLLATCKEKHLKGCH